MSEPCHDRVAEAAACLDLTEFDLFRLAYRRQFGTQPSLEVLERIFARYMLAEVIPPWVHQVCLEVIAQREGGTLSAQTLGAHRYRDRVGKGSSAGWVLGTVAAVWAVLFACLLDLEPERSLESPFFCTNASPVLDAWITIISAGTGTSGCTAAADQQIQTHEP